MGKRGHKSAMDVRSRSRNASPEYALSVIDASLDPFVAISPDGKITDVNGAMVRITGVSRDDLVGTVFADYFTEPDKARACYQQVFAQGFITDCPLTIRHLDGHLAEVLYKASVYKDARGHVLGAIAVAHDVTAMKQASEYARGLIEASLDPFLTISPEGKISDVNEATVRVTGVPRDQLIGSDFSGYFTEPEKARAAYEQVFAKGLVTDYPLTIRHRDGRLLGVLCNVSLYRDISGKVLGAFVAARDVTAHRGAAQYARSLIEASLDPFVTISPAGKITDVNEATVRVTGVPREQLIGTDFSEYFTEPEKARSGYQQVFAKGFVTDYPLTIRHRDGRLTDVLYNASVYKDATGDVAGVFAAARDVTESKRVMHEFTETKNFLDNILQSSTKYSLIGKDLNHKILSWNEGARRNYGYEAHEILGSDSAVLHIPEDVESGAVERLLNTAYEKGIAEGEFIRKRKDGSRFPASVVVTRRDDTEGHPIGFLLMSNDISDKRRVEEQLRVASQYSRSLIEASLDPFVTISLEGKISDVNEATVQVTGHTREELIGTDFSNYFTEPDKARAGYQQVFARGFVMDYPLTIRHRDGHLTEVLYNASVYKDVHGKVGGVFAAARAVTALRQASQYARSLIEASLDPFVTISLEGKVTDVNEATVRATGRTREDLVGTDFSDYFTEPDKARAGYQQVFAKGYVTDYPLTIRHRDGHLTEVLYNASVYKDAHGKVTGVFAAARDVTALRQASQYARSLIEASLDPFVTISTDGKITDVNEATIRVTGVPRDQLIGTDFSTYFTEPDKARAGYQQAFSSGFITDYPLTIRHRDGRLTHVVYNATIYRDVNGKVLGVFAAARDVTAQRRAEAEVAEQRMKEMDRLADLERFRKLTVGRELKMIELKKQIEELKQQLPDPETRP